MLVQAKLVSLLNEVLNQKGRLRKGGSQITFHCPFCADKNIITQKFEVAISGSHTGNYHCWRCNTRGLSFGSLLKKLNAALHYRDEFHKLTGDIRLLRRVKESEHTELALPDEFHPLAVKLDSPEYKNALFYLKKRKLTLEDIVRYNIGYCESGPYENHIIIPSYDADGKLNFFMGRRYYNVGKAIPHKKPEVPMNIIGFESFVNYSEPLNLCEGAFDAIAIRNNAIPLFGKYLQPKLKEAIIVNGVKQVNMILDNDAMDDAIENWQYLQRLGIEVRVIKLDGKDPDVIGYTRMHTLIREAKPFEFEDLIAHKIGL
jgi:DNA primase